MGDQHDNERKNSKIIGTHSGTFHCDDALACALLKMLPEYENAEIVRSRESAVLEKCDVMVDVGGVYDPKTHRFDHHQRDFDLTLNSLFPSKLCDIKLSSAGLVYSHYGHRIIAQLLQTMPTDDVTDIIFDKAYSNFIQEIDAIDNGVNMCSGEKRYEIHTNLSSRVSHLNSKWNEQKDNDPMMRFTAAMNLVQSEFIDCITSYKNYWLPAREIVISSYEKRFEIDESGEIILLERFCPWKDHLLTLEEELSAPETPVKFVLYTDDCENWRVQCVPESRDSFENRLSLPESWRGLRDEHLAAVTSISGCIFVHASGFIGGNKSYDGALAMARNALKSH